MKFQGIVNNRLALVMLILSLVISFEITMKSFNESSSDLSTEVRNNCSTKSSNVQISASNILSCITKCFFAFLFGGVVNEFKFIKIGLI